MALVDSVEEVIPWQEVFRDAGTVKKRVVMEDNVNLTQWLQMSTEELTEMVRENPSLRGMVSGYAAEFHLKKLFLTDPRVKNIAKDDDHARKLKGDLRFEYRNRVFRFESKSLQTNSIKKQYDGTYECTYQCDASDSRKVQFSDGTSVVTTALKVGEFDIVAVCMFPVSNTWVFAFAKNCLLPRSKHSQYTLAQQNELLATSMKISWPICNPYTTEPFTLMDELIDSPPKEPELVLNKFFTLED